MNDNNNLIINKESNKENNIIKNKSLSLGKFYTKGNNSIKYFKTFNNSSNYNINKVIKLKKKINLNSNKAKVDYFLINHKYKQSFINNNNHSKEENLKSMTEIINKLITLKKQINEIKIESKIKKNKMRIFKPIKFISKSKSLSKYNKKNKYILYINDYYKNKRNLILKKNKTLTLETENNNNINNNINKEDNKIIMKTNENVNDLISKYDHCKSLENFNLIKSYSNKNYKKLKKKLFSLDEKKSNVRNTSKIHILDTKFYSNDKNNKIIKNNKIMNNHTNYIEKIKNSELLYLINRYKHSLNKNKNEEINHFKSLVFPTPLINYLIQLKRELIINKYRNQYIKILDRYSSKNKIINVFNFNKT